VRDLTNDKESRYDFYDLTTIVRRVSLILIPIKHLIKNNTTTINIAIISVIIIASFLAPIAAFSQLPYLPSIQSPAKSQVGNQDRRMIITGNESSNSILPISRYAGSSHGSDASSSSNNKQPSLKSVTG
jgi:hypothetical protein